MLRIFNRFSFKQNLIIDNSLHHSLQCYNFSPDGQFLIMIDSEKIKKWNIQHYEDQLLQTERDD
jgi:hypothetical protein